MGATVEGNSQYDTNGQGGEYFDAGMEIRERWDNEHPSEGL